jgi:hypothetical protein
MTARILLILGKTRGHRPRLQERLGDFCKGLLSKVRWLREGADGAVSNFDRIKVRFAVR